jgi:hypothetical protein
MLYTEIIAVCSEIHTKHINKAELYYRAENTVLCIYVTVHETPTSERYRRYDLQTFLCYFVSLWLTI